MQQRPGAWGAPLAPPFPSLSGWKSGRDKSDSPSKGIKGKPGNRNDIIIRKVKSVPGGGVH